MGKRLTTVMRLLQFSDSAFPVGTFSFSNGLESAAHHGIVHDARTLESYTRSLMRQAAYSDGIAALEAWRATGGNRYDRVLETDRRLLRCKMNGEARLMLRRMGKKLAELGSSLFDSDLLRQWLGDIRTDAAPGTYPVAQGITFSLAGVNEKELFCSLQYGVANMILSAALRCVRVSHYDTQRILFALGDELPELYEEIRTLSTDDMNAFVPEADILASLHEKGNMRMFMN